MNNDWFFEKFALIADAPGAIERMRGLVLEAAVRGKLVRQDPNDDPADELLEKIREARRNLAESEKLKTKVQLAPIGLDQSPYSIPKTWLWVPLNELAELVYGKLLPLTELLPNGFPVFGANGVIGRFSKYLYEDEKLLISCRGAYSGTPNISPKQCYVTNNSIVCEFFDPKTCDIRFYHAVISVSPREKIVTGSAQPQVTVANAIKLPVPLPPLAEQKRIVAKVDELMGLCDALESQQQERELRKSVLVRSSLSRFAESPTPENLGYLFHKFYDIPPSELRKSILTLAVQGKLVPQDPNDEPARHVVEKLAITRMQYTPAKHVKNTAKLCDADDNRYIYDIPSSWTWCRFGDLVLDFRYGTSRKCDRNSGGVPVLRIPNIQNGRVDSTDLKFTSMPSAEFAELRLQADDILLVRSNGSEALVGKSAVVCPEDERFAYAGYLVRARLPKKEVFSKYLHVALSARVVRDQIEGPIRTTSGVKNINTKELSNLALPLPPLAEQHRIVTKVDQLMALVDELERQQDASRENASKLLDAIVQEMTNGGQGISATLES